MGRRARVPEADLNDLVGWAGPNISSSVYDHKLLHDQLHEAQEKVGERLREEGYLDAW